MRFTRAQARRARALAQQRYGGAGGPVPLDELALGMRVELEHTRDPIEAAKIAEEHLRERADYYTALRNAGLAGLPGLGIVGTALTVIGAVAVYLWWRSR